MKFFQKASNNLYEICELETFCRSEPALCPPRPPLLWRPAKVVEFYGSADEFFVVDFGKERSHKCDRRPSREPGDESEPAGVGGVDCSHVGSMVMISISWLLSDFNPETFCLMLQICVRPRYGHLEVVEQLMAAPGINMDQLNQVNCDHFFGFIFVMF